MVKKQAPSAKEKKTAPATLRFFMMRGGRVALSFFQNWMPTKQQNSTKEVMKSATIRVLPQAYFVPPHCKARRQDIMQGMKAAMPRKSNFARRCLIVKVDVLLGVIEGVRNATTAIVMPPNGRLI